MMMLKYLKKVTFEETSPLRTKIIVKFKVKSKCGASKAYFIK